MSAMHTTKLTQRATGPLTCAQQPKSK